MEGEDAERLDGIQDSRFKIQVSRFKMKVDQVKYREDAEGGALRERGVKKHYVTPIKEPSEGGSVFSHD